MSPREIADWVLRISVAFAFLYPPLSAWQDPSAWIGYVPPFMHALASPELLLHSFGAVEVALSLWILSGWKVSYPSFGAAIILCAIVVLNPSEFPVLFRDLSIAGAAFVLALLHLPKRGVS